MGLDISEVTMVRTQTERFMSHVQGEPNSGCWLWLGALNGKGYGSYHFSKKTQIAHRVSWQLFKGPIPDGALICHKCDVRICENPEHLFPGTAQDNTDDGVAKGRIIGGFGRKIGIDAVRAIRLAYRDGVKQAEIGRRFGTCASNIHGIVHGKIWKDKDAQI